MNRLYLSMHECKMIGGWKLIFPFFIKGMYISIQKETSHGQVKRVQIIEDLICDVAEFRVEILGSKKFRSDKEFRGVLMYHPNLLDKDTELMPLTQYHTSEC